MRIAVLVEGQTEKAFMPKLREFLALCGGAGLP